MHLRIKQIIENFSAENISEERKAFLQELIDYLQEKVNNQATIRLNFICTHNSRRSHLSQIWAQTMAFHYKIGNIFCYSGGTEATAMFSKVAETLANQGFEVIKLSEGHNPVYAVKYAKNENPIICFSKAYNHAFNPQKQFGAIVTCNAADENCPIVLGAESRFPIKYEDPKNFDGTAEMNEKYAERSLEIGQEMAYVFSQIKRN